MPTKYPVLDKDFRMKMLGSCHDLEERGMIKILDLTGMHVSSLCRLSPESLRREGSYFNLKWIRPKTNLTMQARIPSDDLEDISEWVKLKRKSRQHYARMVKEIGKRAGYDDISPMTFRHNRAIRAIKVEGYTLFEVPHLMGCSLDVVARNYSKLRQDQLVRDQESIQNTDSEG